MARLFNARLLVIATFVLILVSFFGVRSLMAEGKSEAVKTETAKRANVWYEFTQDEDNDPMNPNNYTNRGATDPTGCSEGSELCSANLPDNGAHPSQQDLQAIEDQIDAGEQTSQVTFKNN